MDFVASLSLLTRGIQGGIATFARVTMAVMVGYPPKVIHKYWVHPFQLLEYQWSEGKFTNQQRPDPTLPTIL